MNEQKMAQDHPCVIDIIRRQFLHPPASANEPYNLYGGGEHIDYDPSSGQSRIILDLLKNKVKLSAVIKKIRAQQQVRKH